jgi:hypothetical protein
MSNSRDFSVAGKIDTLLKDTEALCAIKQANNIKANELSIELNMQQTITTINQAQND